MTPLKVTWPIDQIVPNPSPNNRLECSIKMAQAIEHNIFNWLYRHKARRVYILEWQSLNLNLARLDLNMKYFKYWERGDAFHMVRDLRKQGIHALVKVLDFKKLLEMPITEFEALNSPNKSIVRKWREVMKWHVTNVPYNVTDSSNAGD